MEVHTNPANPVSSCLSNSIAKILGYGFQELLIEGFLNLNGTRKSIINTAKKL